MFVDLCALIAATAQLSCDAQIRQDAYPPSDYEIIGDGVAVETSTSRPSALQTAPTQDQDPATRLYAKTGLEVRVGAVSEIIVPKESVGRVALRWGCRPTSHLTVGPCAANGAWVVFPGGYLVRDVGCFDIIVRAANIDHEYSVGIGAPGRRRRSESRKRDTRQNCVMESDWDVDRRPSVQGLGRLTLELLVSRGLIWLPSEALAGGPLSRRGSEEVFTISSGGPAVASTHEIKEHWMSVTVGIDPHKSTHTAVAVDRDKTPLARLTLPATADQTDRLLVRQVGDLARFRPRAQFANYNGTASIDASSANRNRHRVNTRGNRALNHAIHVIAVMRGYAS